MITPLDVLDTAIKIGLGAFISGAAAYWLAKFNYERESNKQRAVHKRELLEGVADSVQKYYLAVAKERAYVEYIVANINQGVEPAQSYYTQLEQSEAGRIDETKELTSAESKLLLLAEGKSYDSLRAFADCVIAFNIDYLKQAAQTKQITAEEYSEEALENYRNALRHHRDSFFKTLSSAYDRT